MKILFEVLKDILLYLILAAIGILAVVKFKITLIVIVCLIGLLIMLVIIANWKYILARRKFFKEYDNTYFLWYSSNKKFKENIENHLIPLLSDLPLEIIYNNRNQIESNLNRISLQILRQKTFNTKLPILFKVKDRSLYHESFYDEVHQLRFKESPVNEFNEKTLLKLEKLKSSKA